jgi:hypothetical protein
LICRTTTSMTQKKDPFITAQTTKCTKHTVASLGQGDEGSENGTFEDPLYSPLASMAWTLPVRADAGASARTHVRIRADACQRPRGHWCIRRTHVRVCADAGASARACSRLRGRECVRADACQHPRGRGSFTPGNFKKDATVRPSHGRPRGHRPIVRPSIRPSVRKHPRDSPVVNAKVLSWTCCWRILPRIFGFPITSEGAINPFDCIPHLLPSCRRTQTHGRSLTYLK